MMMMMIGLCMSTTSKYRRKLTSFTSNVLMSLMIPLPRYPQEVSIWFWCDVMSSWGLWLFWVVTQFRLVCYRRFERAYRSHL